MDAPTIITAAVAFIAPYTPHLLKLGQKSAEEVAKTLAKKGAEAGWSKAVKLWTKLSASFGNDPKTIKTSELLATDPQDRDTQTKLATLLTGRLAGDPALIDELAQILGGESRVQEMIADDLLMAVRQKMDGSGKQTMKTRAIIGATQEMG